MKPTIKQKYKDLFITLIEEDDWLGARNLIDNVIDAAAPSVTINTPPTTPPVEDSSPQVPAPQGTSFDDERQARLNKMNG